MYMLQWHEHHASFFRLMEDLCREQSLTDVTITCGDVSLEAHGLILGASSPILRSILAKGEGKKQTLHFMDMNPFHMQLLLQYMYRGEISVPQAELAPLMASARSLQIKGLCTASTSSNEAAPPAPPQLPVTLPSQPDRLSEFANYLAANTQPQPITSTNLIMPPGDLQPLDASGLINLEPPQQPVIMVNNKKKRNSPVSKADKDKNAVSAPKKRKSKKPFEELRTNHQNGEQAAPDSSNIKHLGEDVEGSDLADQVDGNGVGGITENWSDQQTIKVKVLLLISHLTATLSVRLCAASACDDGDIVCVCMMRKRVAFAQPRRPTSSWPPEALLV